jgi:transposase
LREPHYGKAGRPGADAEVVRTDWKIVPSVQIDQKARERASDRKARFLVATNELSTDTLSDEALLATRHQGKAVPNAAFVSGTDPLFFASSVFVKKPSRIIALSFIMVLSLLIYRLAERRLRQRLQQNQQTIPCPRQQAHQQANHALGFPML